MARIGMIESLKFRRLVRRLGIPRAHARGHLDMLWDACDLALRPLIPRDDIEELAEWEGEPGAFAHALIEGGWLDLAPEVGDDIYFVHDYFEHRMDGMARKYSRALGLPYAAVTSLDLAGYLTALSTEKQRKQSNLTSDTRQSTDDKRLTDGQHTSDTRQPASDARQTLSDRPVPSRPVPSKTANMEDPGRARTTRPAARPIGGLASAPDKSRTAPPRSQPADSPVPVARTVSAALDSLAQANDAGMLDQVTRLYPPAWHPWWTTIWPDLSAIPEWADAIAHVRDCADPAARKAKDLGELRNPGGYLVRQATTLLRRHGHRWPAFPIDC